MTEREAYFRRVSGRSRSPENAGAPPATYPQLAPLSSGETQKGVQVL